MDGSTLGADQSFAGHSYSVDSYPYDCVVYIEAYYSGQTTYYVGSGVIVGPHSILTASHMLWNNDLHQAASSLKIYVGYSGGGGTEIDGEYQAHFYQIDDSNDLISERDAQDDFALIDVATDLTRYGWFGIQTGYSGGQVHVTGYPVTSAGLQSDSTGFVTRDLNFDLLDNVNLSINHGNSGGPVWIDSGSAGNPLPYVVGIVSTGTFETLLTSQDLATIQSWERTDAITLGYATLRAGAGNESVLGSGGDDNIVGWAGHDYLVGFDGNDTIQGGTADNYINGNKGDDSIVGVSLVGDTILGGQGDDRITLTGSSGHSNANGNIGDDTVIGGSGGDTLRGGQGNDSLVGGAAGDWLSGDIGSDTLRGGAGADTFHVQFNNTRTTIVDFHYAEGDRILLDAGGTYSVGTSGVDVLITLAGGPVVVVQGLAASGLDAGAILLG